MATVTRTALFEHELQKLLDEEIERMKDNLSYGAPASFDAYQFQVGKIAGLRSAIDLMGEAESIVNEKLR